MRNLRTYEEFLNEAGSGDTFNPKRGIPLQFDYKKHPELAGEFFNLISTAYSEIGGQFHWATNAFRNVAERTVCEDS